jgi:hypothetical protein
MIKKAASPLELKNSRSISVFSPITLNSSIEYKAENSLKTYNLGLIR